MVLLLGGDGRTRWEFRDARGKLLSTTPPGPYYPGPVFSRDGRTVWLIRAPEGWVVPFDVATGRPGANSPDPLGPIDRFRLAKVWMMRVSGQTVFATGPLAPWSIIIVDNVFHIVTLAVIGKIATL